MLGRIRGGCRSRSSGRAGSYIEDLDGNVFIDFLTGAGVLGARPQPSRGGRGGRAAARRVLSRARLPDRDQGRVHVRAALALAGGDAGADEDPVLRPGRRQRRRCRAQAVQDGDRPRRDRRLPGCVPRQHAQRDGRDGSGRAEGARRQQHARRPLLPVSVRLPLADDARSGVVRGAVPPCTSRARSRIRSAASRSRRQ